MKQIKIPPIEEGEIYVGSIGDASGDLYHIVLLPGDSDDATWKKQMAWAKSIGGDLPTRVEQSLLFANLKDQFKPDWYWSNTPHASGSDSAWFQTFSNGFQNFNLLLSKLRARAVRRLPI